MSTTLKTLKISNGSETRRVTVQKKLTFNELTSLVAGLFNLSAFKIVYQDEENDKITIGSDDEFQEAIETQAKNGVLRLSVKLPSVPKPAEPAAPAPAPVPAQAKPTVAEQAPKPAVATEQAPPKNEGKQEQTNNNAQLPDFQQLLNDFLKTGKVDHSKLREVFSQVGELGKQTAKDASTNVDDVVRALLTSPLAGQLIGLFGEYENNMRQAFSGQPHHGGHHGHHGGRGRWFHHQQQQQQQQNNNNGMEQPQSNVHIHVQCDGCQVQPIVGNRHKCKTCPDYDLCDTCFAKKATIHDAAHEFETRQFAIEPVFHRGVTCDSCQTHPIVGNRYKCKTCPNYDLCDTCFAKKTTVHDAAHEFDKIDRPAIPNRFMWQGRRGPHCGGNWRQFQQQQQQQQAPQQPGQPQPAQPQQQQQPAQPQQGFCGMSRHLGRFISDVSIQDGTIVFVGQKFVKTWRMKNEGSVAWPADTQLVFVGGDQLSEVVSVPVKAAKPGEEVEISVEMTTKAAGRYTSFWRLCADSQRFGHRVWCDVISQVPAAPAPVVAPVPAQPAVIPALSIHPPVPKPVVESAPAPAPAPIPAPAPAPAPVVQTPLDQATEQLVGMGFDAQRARAVLQSVNLDILAAVQILLS